MALTLQMVFQNQLGKNVAISIPEVREDVTSAEIKTLMELILAKMTLTHFGRHDKLVIY